MKTTEIGVLWEKTDKNGNTFYSGRISDQSVFIFKNMIRKEGTNSPTHKVVLAQEDFSAPQKANKNDQTYHGEITAWEHKKNVIKIKFRPDGQEKAFEAVIFAKGDLYSSMPTAIDFDNGNKAFISGYISKPKDPRWQPSFVIKEIKFDTSQEVSVPGEGQQKELPIDGDDDIPF